MAFRWHWEVKRMANVTDMRTGRTGDPRPRGGETEKITINLGPVDLGQIDLLVEEGFYSNRTDLIRTAIRNQLSLHTQVLHETVSRPALVLGLRPVSLQDLEAAQTRGES